MRILGVLAISSAITCFVIAIASLIKTGRGYLPLVASMLSPCVLLIVAFQGEMGHEDIASMTGPDGKEYHLLYQSFMQGKTLSITRLLGSYGVVAKHEVVATAGFDSPQEYVMFVRPAGSPEPGFLFVKDNLIFAGLGDSRAFVAYNSVAKVRYGRGYGENSHHMTEFSPFLLLGKEDSPTQPDVDYLMDEHHGRFDLKVLKTELQNSNPKVRELARRLIDKVTKASATANKE